MRLSFLRGVDCLYGPISGLSWLGCCWLPVQGLFRRSFWVGVGTLWLLCVGCVICSCACLSCAIGFCQGRVSFHAIQGMVDTFWSCICPICWGMEFFGHIYLVISLWRICRVCMGRGFVGRTCHGISLWSRLSWISPSGVTSCLCGVCWYVVRVFVALCCCWVRLSLIIFLFLMRIGVCGCGCFPHTYPPSYGVCGAFGPVMLMGSHVFGWCWFLLVCLLCVCVCVCSGFVGGALFPFMMGRWVVSGFAGLYVLWCVAFALLSTGSFAPIVKWSTHPHGLFALPAAVHAWERTCHF